MSSPNARVFYHSDVPGQTLVQLRGRKRIWIYPPTAPFLRAETVIDPDAPNGVRPIERSVPAAQAQG
ncbi:MAG TPA: hypothetical protein VNP03_20085 [Pseudonocardia sp.]|nr:hypothetical protein [Pseudonocardia sp.]